MMTKTKLALAAVVVFGAASAAQANEPRDEFGGYRVGPLGQSFQGANPAYHRSLRGAGLAYDYVAPGFGGGAGDCRARFRSYDPASGTYLGFDGARHLCR
jgi:BA14K-like protein